MSFFIIQYQLLKYELHFTIPSKSFKPHMRYFKFKFKFK